eukprot:341358_1
MIQYNHHILTLNYVYGIFGNPKMQFLINLVKYKCIYSYHKIMPEKYGFFTFIWTSRLRYSTCYIFYWSKQLQTHCFNEPEKPQSQSAKKIVGKNDEIHMKPKSDVDILLNMLKWHGIKCISSVKCVDYIDSYESMAWTIIVLSARIEKH